ncbi:uncharacterized protein LOC135206550 [Macrobrachium nipponense]|uniref:uncharacterized protein LOC135206550 n=1 Tax=Macrobrachium nipponense TaxID=159736 RepID=UPI0030C8B51A
MKPDAAALTIRKQKAPKCDGPFTLTEVGCIMLLEELRIAKTCRRLCQSLDADLAVVEMNEQQKKLWDILKSIYNKPNFSFFWIGIEKSQWLTGVPVTTFTSPNSCGTIRENGVIRESLECAEALNCVCQRFVYE